MSRTEATARARELRESLLDHGVAKVSIELVAGRGAGGWSDDRFVGSMGHHIVSRRTQGQTPFLSLVKTGRSDLPGPLCNGYGGFDETARIICMGWANHPGAGGPFTVEAGTIPRNNGRPYLFGWEFEGGVLVSDWTDSFREFMGRCHAGTLAWLGRTEQSHLEHKDWAPTRKIDRLGYILPVARLEAARYLNPTAPNPGALMTLPIVQGDHEKDRRSDIAYFQHLINVAFGRHRINVDGTYGINMASRLVELGVHPTGERIDGNTAWRLWELATRQLIAAHAPAAGTVDQVARSAITALRNHLRKS